MILYVALSLVLAFIHALKVLNKWIRWESSHPPKKSSVPKTDEQAIEFVLAENQSYPQLKKSTAESNYSHQLINYSFKKDRVNLSDGVPIGQSTLDIMVDEDVQILEDWLKTINAYSQYPYVDSFQTPILYAHADNWKQRLQQVRSLKYLLQIFMHHQEDKQIHFARMITIQNEANAQTNRLMTNPEFVAYSNNQWSPNSINEKSLLLKLYPLIIAIHVILGFVLNPIFGFLALMQIFIYAIVDYLVTAKLASFYSLPKATKWYIISFSEDLKNAITSFVHQKSS